MAIELSGVSLTRGGKSILREVSCRILPQTVTGVVGPNGSGKSSLLRTIYGFLPVTAGQIAIDDTALAQWSPQKLASHLGVCPQEAEPSLDFRVDQVLALRFGGRRASLAERTTSLDFLRLEELFDRHLSELSGGERQRVRLGMALLSDSPWLILDEPANHLDLATAWSLLEFLRRPRRGGVVLALHDLAVAARFCSSLLVLKQGRVVTHGPPREVLQSEVLKGVFRLNAAFDWNADPITLKVSGVAARE